MLDVPPSLVLGVGLWRATRHSSERRRRVWARAARAAYVVVTTATLGGTFGQLLAGLRVVDAASRQRVGWRQATSLWAMEAGPGIVVSLWLRDQGRKINEGIKQRLAGIELLDENDEAFADDPEGLDQRRAELYYLAIDEAR
jgi:hypothetical protein